MDRTVDWEMQWDIDGEPLPARGFAAERFAPSPPPEDVFIAWVMRQPAGADLSIAAQAEILKLRAYRGPHPGPRRLEALFSALRRELAAVRTPATRQ